LTGVSVHARAVRRAAAIVGGLSQLADKLHVSVGIVRALAEGRIDTSEHIFLRVVDIVTEHELSELMQASKTIGQENTPSISSNGPEQR